MQKNRKKLIIGGLRLSAIILFAFFGFNANSAEAAAYNWYFSNSVGNDTTGNGTEASPWKTLAKVQAQENTLGAADIANFYFKRGDIWTFTHTGSPSALVSFNNCIINIDAYGSGAAPIFDGGITFVTSPLTGSRHHWDSVMALGYTGSTIKNVEIKNNHGWGIGILCPAKNVTIQYVSIHNVGHAAISSDANCENYGNLVEYSTIYDAMRLEEKGYQHDMYAGGISMTGKFSDNTGPPHDNTVRYCHVYNVYGEGIWNPEGITEYNVVGNTWAPGIHTPAQGWDSRTTIVRYNLIYGTPGTIYTVNGAHGILFADDETAGGNNSNGESWIYGNIIINRDTGLRMYDFAGYMVAYPYGKVRVFNNTMIDCRGTSYGVEESNSFADVKIYNNSSILYTASIYGHAFSNFSSDAQWIISNNHFWAAEATWLDPLWRTNMNTGDPKLPKTSGWRNLSSNKDTIDFLTMLYPEAGSALIGNGMTLSSEFDGMTNLLTAGTHFDGDLGPSSFVSQDQRAQSAFSLGAVLRSSGDTTPPAAPTGFKVE